MTIHRVVGRHIKTQNTKRIAFCTAFLYLLDTTSIEDATLDKFFNDFIARVKKRYKYMLAAKSRISRKRKSWEELTQTLTEIQFRRYFRMSQDCFADLCNKIEEYVGPQEFKRERFIHDLEAQERNNSKTMIHLHRMTTGSFVSGEIKIAVTLWLLAGGSYLDLSLLFGISIGHIYKIFHMVIDKWFLDDQLVTIDGVGYCMDERKMECFARGFCETSDGVFASCIGAIDGWLIKIKKPSVKRDGVNNPASYYSRKGFYGVNVQVIVSHEKMILYHNILHCGIEHDSKLML